MSIKYNLLAFLSILFLLFSNTINAENPLTKETLEKLIAGHTAEGKSVQWEKD